MPHISCSRCLSIVKLFVQFKGFAVVVCLLGRFACGDPFDGHCRGDIRYNCKSSHLKTLTKLLYTANWASCLLGNKVLLLLSEVYNLDKFPLRPCSPGCRGIADILRMKIGRENLVAIFGARGSNLLPFYCSFISTLCIRQSCYKIGR